MDSRQDFYKTIYEYYYEVVNGKVPTALLDEMCDRITDYYFEQYTRFREQYPKSVKRYSTFQIKDLNHPQTFEIIINYFKETTGNRYADHSMIALGWTLEKLREFEKWRQDFYNIS